MALWYCYVGGQQYGPVPFETLLTWLTEGRVRPTDYVWQEGAPSWAPAFSIQRLCAEPSQASPTSLVPANPPGGTEGRTLLKAILAEAWAALRSRWGLAIVFYLIWQTIFIVIGYIPYFFFSGALQHLGTALYVAILLTLTGPVQLSLAVFFLAVSRGGPARIHMILAGFKVFGRAVGMCLLRLFFLTIWAILGLVIWLVLILIQSVIFSTRKGLFGPAHNFDFLAAVLLILTAILASIPLIRALLSYSQAMYFLADDTTLGPLAVIQQSQRVMTGRKGKLFLLWLPFGLLSLGMTVLSLWLLRITPPSLRFWSSWITIIVSSLWVPFLEVCLAKFYDDLRPPRPVASAASTPPPPVPAELQSPDPASGG